MNAYQTLSFQEMELNAQVKSFAIQDDFKIQQMEDKGWGELELRTINHPHVSITSYKANLNGRYQLHYDAPQMPHSMNVCLVMDGSVGLRLTDSKFSTNLSTLQHHNIYANETAYSLCINQFVNVVHLAIDLEYYAGLLCEQDRWTAEIRERILKKELVCHADGQVNAAMKLAAQQILNNSLMGSMKKLMIEAKVLEIMALQLNEFASQRKRQIQQKKMCTSDSDVFYDLRNYLDQHFTDDLSLKSLSRMFGINEFKLKKGFKELFEATVFEYVHELKMNYSRRLLSDHQLYVNEVASKVGYKNPNHFSTAFKRKFGINPTALK